MSGIGDEYRTIVLGGGQQLHGGLQLYLCTGLCCGDGLAAWF